MLPLALVVLSACRPPATPVDDIPVPVTLVAFNDFHGALYERPTRHDPTRATGGLPWLHGAIEALREDDPDLLLLHAGDAFQGDWPVNASQGMGAVRALDLLGVDATVPGNHDFDHGGVPGGHPLRGALHRAVEASSFPWVVANVRHADTGEPWTEAGIRPWTLLERRGVQVGVTGVLTQDTPQTTLTENVRDLEFTDPAEAVAAVVPELRAAGADAVVVLAHLDGACEPDATGYAEPAPTCDPQGELGAFLDGLEPGAVDVVLAGHAHALIAHHVDGVFLVESRGRGQILGGVDLVVGPDGVDHEASRLRDPWVVGHAAVDPGCEPGEYDLSPQEVDGRVVTPSAEALELVRSLEESAGSLCDEVGCAEVHLDRDREGPSPVGDLVADSMLAAFDRADLAVANSGGLRADIPAGPLRREHLHGVIPFDNRLVLVELPGHRVELLFRIGSSGRHGILQVAGATYAFDPDAGGGTDLDGDGAVDTWERDRLCGVEVGGEPLDPDRTYRVVVTDFLLHGGDHLAPVFEGIAPVAEGPLAREALIGRVEASEACLAPAGEERIQVGTCTSR